MKKIHKMWRMPLWLFFLSLAGLIIALKGNGIWNIIGWASLSIPLLTILKHYYK